MIAIRPAVPADIDRLTELEIQLFASDRISRRQFRYLLKKPDNLCYAVIHQEVLVGYALFFNRRDSRKMRIYSIGVDPGYRKLGIARKLLTHAEEVAEKNNCNQITLEVCEHNTPAIELYRNAGYEIFGKKPDYYEDGCDALRLRKTLRSEEIGNDPSRH